MPIQNTGPVPDVITDTDILTDWGNAVGASSRGRVVHRFASTTERDAAITSPIAGMLCYVSVNNLWYGYTGSTWAPLSLVGRDPQGWLGSALLSAASGSVGGTVTPIPGTSAAVTVGAGRRLKVSAFAPLHKDATASIVRFYIMEGPTWAQIGASIAQNLLAGQYGFASLFTVINNPVAGSHTYAIGIEADGGTVTINADPGMPASLVVEDIGPYP